MLWLRRKFQHVSLSGRALLAVRRVRLQTENGRIWMHRAFCPSLAFNGLNAVRAVSIAGNTLSYPMASTPFLICSTAMTRSTSGSRVRAGGLRQRSAQLSRHDSTGADIAAHDVGSAPDLMPPSITVDFATSILTIDRAQIAPNRRLPPPLLCYTVADTRFHSTFRNRQTLAQE